MTRGIDVERVFIVRGAAGLVTDNALADPTLLLDLICAPGLSTREEVDRASGRGVGMAVVRNTVEELGGTLSLRTRQDAGSCFTIQLPLTLAIADALVVAVGAERYAVPQVSVREVVQLDAAAVTALENNEIIYYRGGVLPLLRLGTFFGLGATASQYALVAGSGSARLDSRWTVWSLSARSSCAP